MGPVYPEEYPWVLGKLTWSYLVGWGVLHVTYRLVHSAIRVFYLEDSILRMMW